MDLKTLKKGLTLNENITDKGGNFDYYIAKIGHLKKNIAIGKYDIFTEAVGQYKKVAEIEPNEEIKFLDDGANESQWFEGLARSIKDKFENAEDVEEVKKEKTEEEKEKEAKKKEKEEFLKKQREGKQSAADVLEKMRERRRNAGKDSGSQSESEYKSKSETANSKAEDSIKKGELSDNKDLKMDFSDEEFKKKLESIKAEMEKAKQAVEAKESGLSQDKSFEARGLEKLEDEKIDDLSKKDIFDSSKKIWKTKNLSQNQLLEQDSEEKGFESSLEELEETQGYNKQKPNIELLKKYLKQGTKAGLPASKTFLFSIGYVFYSNINLFQKLFLSVLLLSSSILILITSLFYFPIYLLEKVNKKILESIKQKIKKKDDDNGIGKVKVALKRLPITLLILYLYVPIILTISALFLLIRTIGFSVVFIALSIIITLVFSFGYLFYEENIGHIFHEDFDLEEHKKLSKKKRADKKKKKKNIEEIDEIAEEEAKKKEIQSLDEEGQRHYDIINSFINSEYEIGIKTEKAIRKKIDKIISPKSMGIVTTKDLLISMNRKLVMEGKEITNYKELCEALKNKDVLEMFL